MPLIGVTTVILFLVMVVLPIWVCCLGEMVTIWRLERDLKRNPPPKEGIVDQT